ncbi:MAG: ABC transporter ATP-binding protein [Actinobacteria bacterium]|nr:ABC transporter ATP-binding protein [Actinomycetota bacterium]
MKVLEVSDLTITTHGGVPLVRGLSFTIGRGERLGLIGESGSGKSLTALAIMGLLPGELYKSGEVSLSEGESESTQILTAKESALNQIRGEVVSVIFQEPLTALDPLMRVGRQLAEPLRRHRKLTGRALQSSVIDALTEVRINNPARIARAYPHEISGGERQRVAIAMALACEPTLLIADEPTTALDVTVQAEILGLLDGLVEHRHMSLLFISHDLAVVSQITDRVLVLKEGEFVESGSIEEITHNPQHSYTRNLVASALQLDSALDFASTEGGLDGINS